MHRSALQIKKNVEKELKKYTFWGEIVTSTLSIVYNFSLNRSEFLQLFEGAIQTSL